MSGPRSGRINRRELAVSTMVGGAALFTTRQPLRAGIQPVKAASRLVQQDSSGVPMFRGDAARTGGMPGPGPDPTYGLETVWSFDLGTRSLSTPAVVNGTVYVGSDYGSIYAIDESDGTVLWQFMTGGSVWSSPAVADGVVYLGSDDGNIYALNASDGTERWRFGTGASISTSPAVIDGLVYIGSTNGILWALDANDGTEAWQFTYGLEWGTSPAVADGVVYVGNNVGTLYSVDALSGAERWRFVLGESAGNDPVVADGFVYWSTYEKLFAIDVVDGTERWQNDLAIKSVSSPAVADGIVYIGTWVEDHTLYAYDGAHGGELWRFTTDAGIWASPSIADGTVFVAGGLLYALDAKDGAKRWEFATEETGHATSSAPTVVVNGKVYYKDADGMLFPVSGQAPRLREGGRGRVIEKTHLRGGPAPTAVERAELDVDTVVTITGESVTTGEDIWWPVSLDEQDLEGWVLASTLEPIG